MLFRFRSHDKIRSDQQTDKTGSIRAEEKNASGTPESALQRNNQHSGFMQPVKRKICSNFTYSAA